MIAIVTPNRDFFTNPTLVNVLKNMLERGIAVTLVMPDQLVPAPQWAAACPVISLPRYPEIWPRRPKLILNIFKGYHIAWQALKQRGVKTLLAVDPLGLVIAGRLSRLLRNITIHYLSFEIFYADEIGQLPFYQKLKKKEIRYSALVSSVVVQDKWRFALLNKENHFSPEAKTFFIPVSPSQSTASDPGKNYRQLLGIPGESKTILHSGSVADWSGGELIKDLISSGIPHGYTLVIHNRFPFDPAIPLHSFLIEAARKDSRLVLHDNAFSDYAEYTDFVSQFDFGLAFYSPDFKNPYTGKNISEIGLASGKFSTYMMLGLPVFFTPSVALQELNAEYGFGLEVTDGAGFRELLAGDAPSRIRKENCTAFYSKHLDTSKVIHEYVSFLNN